jgi:predicted Zn-dependent protease
MRSLLVAAALVVASGVLAPPVAAQTGGVEGQVVDEEGRPLADSVVIIESLRVSRKNEVKTNKDGRYRMIGLQAGPYRVTATKDAYQARYVEVDVHLGDPTKVMDIQLVSLAAVEAVTGPSEPELRERFNRAVEQIRAGELDEAEATFLDLATLYPDVAEFHQNLGYVYAKKKDWARAEASYEAALAQKPNDPALTLALAGVHEDAGEPDRALAILSEAAVANPKDGSLQFERGMLLLKSKKPAEAAEALEAALANDPSRVEAHYFLGTLLVNEGKVPEAVEHFEAYLASNPENERFAETAKGMLEALKR